MQLTKKHHEFLSYLFTLQFLKTRFKDFDKDNNFIFIPVATLRTLFFPKPTIEIEKLLENGFIIIKEQITEGGYPIKLMRTKGVHNLNFSNFEYTGAKLDDVTIKMRSYLKHISLPDNVSSTIYFDKFIEVKDYNIECFFKVDHFSGRVHTPVTSLKSEYRSQLLIKGEQTVSLDVVTMQPLLLGKILHEKIGYNEYSYWIHEGEDIYIKLQQTANLKDRPAAKTKFFQILFGRSNENLATIFGNADWIEWINEFKSKPLHTNPNTEEKEHSNLAWLLQTTEVKLMRKIWEALIKADIIFLTVHDEIIVRESDAEETYKIMEDELKLHFPTFKINQKAELNTPDLDYLEKKLKKLDCKCLHSKEEFLNKYQFSFDEFTFMESNKLILAFDNMFYYLNFN
ncbi:MAG: hypothetical protein K9G36_10530 [Crocinitomicaceae bacterium]|nr:hypothetical protein [Crocinitomicaceae bacterium]